MKKENNNILFGKDGYLFEKLMELNEQTSRLIFAIWPSLKNWSKLR
jgi:hypothetical protein